MIFLYGWASCPDLLDSKGETDLSANKGEFEELARRKNGSWYVSLIIQLALFTAAFSSLILK
jgi:hypothetical protein